MRSIEGGKKMISIIIPVYNVELYLDRCIESVVRQTYHNLEIILVDDGSTDSSGERCDVWRKKDSRIKVIHKENGGVSSARNVGLKIASGEYVGYVDSDDYVNVNMYQILLDGIEQTGADIFICGYEEVDTINNRSIWDSKKIGRIQVFNSRDSISEIQKGTIKNYVFCRLYRKSSLRFDFLVDSGWEDEAYTLQNFSIVNKIAVCDTVLYYYFKRSDSLTGYGTLTPIGVLYSDQFCIKYCVELMDQELIGWRLRIALARMIQAYYQRGENEQHKKEKAVIIAECKKQVLTYGRYYRVVDWAKILMFLVFRKNPYSFQSHRNGEQDVL